MPAKKSGDKLFSGPLCLLEPLSLIMCQGSPRQEEGCGEGGRQRERERENLSERQIYCMFVPSTAQRVDPNGAAPSYFCSNPSPKVCILPISSGVKTVVTCTEPLQMYTTSERSLCCKDQPWIYYAVALLCTTTLGAACDLTQLPGGDLYSAGPW